MSALYVCLIRRDAGDSDGSACMSVIYTVLYAGTRATAMVVQVSLSYMSALYAGDAATAMVVLACLPYMSALYAGDAGDSDGDGPHQLVIPAPR